MGMPATCIYNYGWSVHVPKNGVIHMRMLRTHSRIHVYISDHIHRLQPVYDIISTVILGGCTNVERGHRGVADRPNTEYRGHWKVSRAIWLQRHSAYCKQDFCAVKLNIFLWWSHTGRGVVGDCLRTVAVVACNSSTVLIVGAPPTSRRPVADLGPVSLRLKIS